MHGKLMTNAERYRRHITVDNSCHGCDTMVEDIMHVLRDCPAARDVWNHVLQANAARRFFAMGFEDWVQENLSTTATMQQGTSSWNILFAIICWLLWKDRCNKVFNSRPGGSYFVLLEASRLYQDCVSLIHNGATRNCGRAGPNSRDVVKWQPPNPGRVKVNIDGAVRGAVKQASIGGVIRNDAGDWVFGFVRNIGACTALMAELWAAYDALIFVWERGFRSVDLKTDNKTMATILNMESSILSDNALVQRLRKLVLQQWDLSVRFIYREANMVADKLASLAQNRQGGCLVFDTPPPEVTQLITDDIGR
ncbi:hypothetical protein like AT5G42905 [Hibiscus trionum]|uniref:RNase H type-1 domain-containing protein n=1 Tax=Hibiscus trionum TaxID=183268 RepID=A0A9W7H7R4_HIBTR|nr:hypothetical protein like AT5G42905 [Hibiscus trionum]